MRTGADKDEVVLRVYHSTPFEILKFWGEVLKRLKLDESGKFAWAAVPYSVFRKYGSMKSGRESAASSFAQIIDGTDFGLIMVEEEKKKLSVSFRSRTGFDTSKIAVALGGGGHVYASGGSVKGKPFEKAVEYVLRVARVYAKKT